MSDRPGPWSELFDPFDMDHVCEAVRVAIVNVSLGEPSMIYDPLQRFLIYPLWAYIEAYWEPPGQAAHLLAAYALEAEAAKLADLFRERHPFDESVADLHAQSLRLLWLEFIAHGAGHFMAYRVPRMHAQRVAAPKGKKRGWPRFLSDEDVVATVAAASPGATYEDLIFDLCDRARANVPAGKSSPPGDPGAAAKRAYRAAVQSGRIRPRWNLTSAL